MVPTVIFAALGLACIGYGATIMAVGSGSKFFLFWFAVGAVLLLFAWLVHSGNWSNMHVAARRATGVVVAVLLVGCLALVGLVASQFGSKGEKDLDYIVVLGAQVREKELSVALRSRLDAACDYLLANPDTTCIVTGGQGPNEPVAEADAMGDYLEQRGIAPSRIIREDKAENTVQNIEYSSAFLDPSNARVGIITNDYHLFRSLAIARKRGFNNVCGISAGFTPWYLPNNMVREALGIVKDFAQGNL